MTSDYSDIMAAVASETVESLRRSYEGALCTADEHRKKAEQHQNAADTESHYADRDDERARQWKIQLGYAESYAQAVVRHNAAADQAAKNSEAQDDAWSTADDGEVA